MPTGVDYIHIVMLSNDLEVFVKGIDGVNEIFHRDETEEVPYVNVGSNGLL